MAFKNRQISLIMAALSSGMIGTAAGLPWHDKEDLQWFKKTTMGGTLIMGRVTFETLKHPLAGRNIVILSKSQSFGLQGQGGVYYADSIEKALELADEITAPSEEIFIAGGVTVYSAALPYADRFYVSRISQEKRLPLTDKEIEEGAYSPFPLPWYESSEV